jgi:hypothetical protein
VNTSTIRAAKVNAAISAALGWKIEKSNERDGLCWHLNGIQSDLAPPDYYNDLNAMHEAEETLSAEECIEFCRQLAPPNVTRPGAYETFELVHAKPHLRAEAWLRAKKISI